MMIFDKLIEILKRIMPQVDTSKITKESVLTTDVGIDSLNLMLLAITVEDEFNIHFDSTNELKTVGDICNFVETHMGK